MCHNDYVAVVEYLEQVQTLLTENDTVRALIPAQFRTVLTTALDRLDLAMRPGLISVRWTSLGVEDYFKNVTKALANLRQLVKKVHNGSDLLYILMQEVAILYCLPN